MSTIQNSVFIITGAGSGIGRALAIEAENKGAKVIISDVDDNGLNETMVELKGNCIKYNLDVSKPEQIEQFAKDILEKYPTETIILVNNAGVGLFSGTFSQTPLADFEWLLNINLWGVVHMTQAFLPHLLKINKGHIINVSSIYGIAGMANNSAYCTAKFAVKGFTDVLKAEVLNTNVKISSVHPGGIKTNIAKNTRITPAQDNEQTKKLLSKFEKIALKMPPRKAAQIILKGIEKEQSRILIGNDAKLLDLVVRLFPNTYFKLVNKVFKP